MWYAAGVLPQQLFAENALSLYKNVMDTNLVEIQEGCVRQYLQQVEVLPDTPFLYFYQLSANVFI